MNTLFYKKIIILGLVIAGIASFVGTVSAGIQDNVSGYAFSYMPTESNGKNQNYNPNGGTVGQGTGWISLNCTDEGTCANANADDYGVNIDPTSGQFSGYGWAGHFGWVNFAGASVSPSCFTAGGTHNVTGTIQYTTNGGGWNGTVFMNSQGGVTWNDPVTITCDIQAGTGTFGGHAWGNGVVGWIDFSEAVLSLDTVVPPTCTGYDGLTYSIIGGVIPPECQQTTCTTSSGALVTYYVMSGVPRSCDRFGPKTDGRCESSEVPGPLTSAPNILCSQGLPTSVSGSGPWTWGCMGLNGGQNTTCLAEKDINSTVCTNPAGCPPGGPIIPIYTEN
jgi:hypothetical protein